MPDHRGCVEVRDVRECFYQPKPRYDAILLDVDIGPDGLIYIGNDQPYGKHGLRVAHAAPTLGGVLAVWSTYPDNAFADRMRHAGFSVDERKVHVSGGRKGAHHII